MNIKKTFVDILNEAKKEILSSSLKNKINKSLIDLTTPKHKTVYFKEIPIKEISNILKKFDIVILQEDNTKWSGFLVGESSYTTFDIANIKSEINNVYKPISNVLLVLQWHKMSSGKYEINTYIS